MTKTKRKTLKSAAKRFKLTGTGKVVHRSHHIRHLKSSKSKSQLRRLRLGKVVEGTVEKKIKQMLGEA